VFLSLPSDILTSEADLDLQAPTRVGPRLRADAEAIAAAAALLAKAERPVILAGDAVAQSRAHAELVKLAETVGATVYTEFIPNTASFPASHPLFRGAMVRLAKNVRDVLGQHDLVLSAGADLFALSLPSDVEPMPSGMPVIHLDTDAWELGKNYPAQVALLGDPKATLDELAAATAAAMSATAKSRARERLERAGRAISDERAALRAKARGDAGRTPVQPLALFEAIGRVLPKDTIIVEEALSSAPGIRQMIDSDDPQSFFGLRGGGIGWGLPAAIGVKLALPSRPVVGLIGDGSAMYTCQALWTAAHDRIGAVFIILNNGSYRILKQRLTNLRGHAVQQDSYVGMDLVDPAIDFVGLARSLGVRAERTTTVAETVDLLKGGIAENAPLLIDVATERAFKPV